MKKKWNTLLGFYQNQTAALDVLKKLRQKGYKRSLSIHRSQNDKLKIDYYGPSNALIMFLLLLIASNTALYFLAPKLNSYIEVALGIIVTFCLWLAYTTHLYTVNAHILNRFKTSVLRNETLIIVQIQDKHVRNGLNILRAIDSDNPITFLLRSETFEKIESTESLDKEIETVTTDQLEERAAKLASELKKTKIEKTKDHYLKLSLRGHAKTLERIRQHLSEAEHIEQTVTISGSWLLDNDYIIQENIKEIERSLPLKYYNQLPKIIDGKKTCTPRIYALAKTLIDATANRLNKDNILTFLKAYQSVDPLTIGELWAFPIMMRIYLIERMQSLAQLFDQRLREGESARFWGNRLLSVARKQPVQLNEFLNKLKKDHINPSPHFIEELLEQLFDEDTVLLPLREWVEKTKHSSLNDLIQTEQKLETINEVAFSSAVISLISLKQLSWREIFESTSQIDEILKKDPIEIYEKMNFATRDSYRHAVEVLAKQSKFSEFEIARLAIEMAQKGKDEVTRHVGYYLIDEGRLNLGKNLNSKPSIFQRFRGFMLANPSSIYLGSITAITFIIALSLFALSNHFGASLKESLFFTALSLFPASEIGVQIMHLILPFFLRPHVLPKMNYENGVPEINKTFVVIPMMLKSEESFQKTLNQLEIHYLANSDPVLKFGLLLDYTDAATQTLKEDADLLGYALNGMQGLTDKYGPHKFFLFLRSRVWSESESAWIGWERKRGKLESLNRFLADPNYMKEMLRFGSREDLQGTRYVITLDADTELPKNKAIQLIEAISHPLNTARLTSKNTIERGYTIIQPRVSTDISEPSETYFSKIYADVVGINPYTEASTDIYQDLMQEGSYHGKCIYDLNAFDKILSNRFPDEHLLSHDLIEGAYVRVAYASDISLFDLFPQTYQAWSLRHHRWMRGDWQIIDWLFSKVPFSSSSSPYSAERSNPPSPINRWKIFDNFRRALTPPIILTLMICSWLFSSSVSVWNILILTFLFIPTFFGIFSNPLKYCYEPLLSFKQIGLSTLKVLISIALLPHQAFLSIDALVRVTYRRCVSHKRLLEWSQNSHLPNSKEHRLFLFKLLGIIVFALSGLGVQSQTYNIDPFLIFEPRELSQSQIRTLNRDRALVAKFNAEALIWASGFCILWMLAPLIVYILDNPALIKKDRLQKMTADDQKFIHKMARRTWRYFDDFVNTKSNFLPPDNFQASLRVEIAQRTSPTNIGLWMLACVTAYDLRYISYDEMLNRLKSTFDTLNKLETYQGHLLNWYDTNSLKPLVPRYVSTVDNGNLLSSLWTLEQSIADLVQGPIIPLNLFDGFNDTLNVLCEELRNPALDKTLNQLRRIFLSSNDNSVKVIHNLRSATSIVQELKNQNINEEEPRYWLNQLEKELNYWNDCAIKYLKFVDIAIEIPLDKLKTFDLNLFLFIEKLLNLEFSYQSLASGNILSEAKMISDSLQSKTNLDAGVIAWMNNLQEAYHKAKWYAAETIQASQNIVDEANKISESTKMEFLYNSERKLFSIGFHVDDCKLDNSFYDLLASEARVASLVSIAKGDVPLEHWWSLGRPYRIINGKKILVSWGGTMFEYMMPLLYTKYYPDSLLGNACKNAVTLQIQYGKKRGIPWGISESAFSEIDTHRIYQYRSFGVPELGFKRALEKDLIVSPYSSALAIIANPIAALKNLKTLADDPYNLYATHGFYESIDFTRQQGPQGERGIIIYAFMAHHQGMSLLSFNNILNNNIIQERFHRDPRIKGVESLLYEQVPSNPPMSQGYKRDVEVSRLPPFPILPIMGVLNTPHTSTPKINLLANGSYSVMLTNTGRLQ